MRLNVDVNYTDEFYSALDLDPATEHDSATKINARIALASVADTWSIALIGKNLTDETTYVWQNDVPAQASNTYFAVPERPRSIAIQGRYRF
jgi:outer membrane receptor protein involved in Fe transport